MNDVSIFLNLYILFDEMMFHEALSLIFILTM